MIMTSLKIEDFKENVFTKIGKEWMLIGTSQGEKSNAMTASWGGLGIMWGKEVAFVFIRESRYTKKLVDNGDSLSLSFFDESYKKMLGYMGQASGKNEDKIKTANLHMLPEYKVPVFEEASMTMICKKLYAQPMSEEFFTDRECVSRWYGDNDYHTMYVVEIESIEIK